MRRFASYRPALPGPSQWIIDPEPDPDAARYPKVHQPAAGSVVPGAGSVVPLAGSVEPLA